MRVGISYIAKRFSKENNKYMKSFDNKTPSKYITYLLGVLLSNDFMYLLFSLLSGFKWFKQNEIDKFCLNSIGENSSIGYILEFDLEYPNELHDLHNDYPLVPERLEITHNILLNYCSSIANEYDIKIGDGDKLVSNLGSKNKYVLHYKNLQLSEIHGILKFKQTDEY